jgi:PLP dependent protein
MSLSDIRARATAAAIAAGRDPASITLIAVSKEQPESRVLPVLEAGHRIFGENRVQEAAGKWPGWITRFGPVELHLLGPLQTNKARTAMELFHHHPFAGPPQTGANPRAAGAGYGPMPAALCAGQHRRGAAKGRRPAPRCRQLHSSGPRARSAACRRDVHPPVDDPPAPHFAHLAEIGARNGLEACRWA